MTPHTHTCLWFDTQAEEAAAFYRSVFPGSRITGVLRHGPGEPMHKGAALQGERYGVSWQIVPSFVMERLAGPGTQRLTAAMRQMRKLHIAALERAHAGQP